MTDATGYLIKVGKSNMLLLDIIGSQVTFNTALPNSATNVGVTVTVENTELTFNKANNGIKLSDGTEALQALIQIEWDTVLITSGTLCAVVGGADE